MEQEINPFPWGDDSTKAAELLARDILTDEAIAIECGVSRTTVWRWKQHPEFAARIEARRAELHAEIRRLGISTRENRVKALNDRWNRLRRLIEARADDPTMADVPGGTTGLLVKSKKGLGSGENFEIVTEYAVDTGTLRELREQEKQAAQELGQWAEKHELTGKDGGPLEIEATARAAATAELDQWRKQMTERLASLPATPPTAPPTAPPSNTPNV